MVSEIEKGMEGSLSDEDKSDLENDYLAKSLRGKAKGGVDDEGEGNESSAEHAAEGSDSGSETDTPPQHESLAKSSRGQKKAKKVKVAPRDETAEQRNARTIFIGNLNVEVAQKKPLRKQLQRHILSLIPTSGQIPKVESIRFRSVPFAIPTSDMPDDGDIGGSTSKLESKKKQSRQHDVERTSSWRDQNGEGDNAKKFLTPAQKKKVAFIKQDFHDSADSVHAYIVFAHADTRVDENPKSAPIRNPNLPPPPEVMDPYEAARLAKEACDGTTFMDRVIRVDVAARNTAAASVNSEGHIMQSDVDPKRCVFVGNLDFESREEDVRAFFEGVVAAEKGPCPARSKDIGDQASDMDASKPNTWVKRVRIIRDKETQLGKGFAYVQFTDRECVDEVLALDSSKLKFAKRKLRVERCKTLPGVSTKVSSSVKQPKSSEKPRQNMPGPVPKGDPGLGEKLAHLSKEARKQAKATDSTRVARRLAKKKARMALAVPGKGSDSELKIQSKDRNRERKTAADKKGNRKHGVGSATKGRVRSEKSIAKRNLKK
ncbi:Nucleolar protein 12 [Paramarasmius palmivorus]|uniref:Nucleolar protein 12 n=1 Tax=Paramarasmius palmivorus TaxID=297713 RepID=A0AAW0E8G0_9AGAR